MKRRSSTKRIAAITQRVVPTLSIPHIRSFRNRWSLRHGLLRKEALSAILTIGMIVGLYLCSSTMFDELTRAAPDPSVFRVPIMSALVMALFVMVLLSSSVSAVSALYVSKDIDFLLSSPVSTRTLLAGKVAEITLSTCWMLLVFGIPIYISFGDFLSAGFAYYCVAPAIIVAFLTPALLLGVGAAILFSSLLPARGGRYAFAFLFATSIGFFFAIINNSRAVILPAESMSSLDVAHIAKTLPSYALPASWIARSIEALATGDITLAMLVIGSCAILTALLWLLVTKLFQRLFLATYTKLQASSSPLQIDSRFGRAVARFLFAATRRGTRALVTKEVYAFSRELTQTLQLAMLLTICALYSYNFSQLNPPTRVGVEILQLWDVFMTASNVLLGLMVILSISSRFVFPSVSLEGGSLWILQVAPLSTRDILRAKYTSWFAPILLVAFVIFSAGGCAIGMEPQVILASVLSGSIISHGIVSLGLGFGARFARFDWEHTGQLATNSGNMAYMLTGIVFLAMNMIPVTIMFGAYFLLPGIFRDDAAALILLASGLTVLSIINITAGRIAISIGARALQRGLS